MKETKIYTRTTSFCPA